MKSIPERHTCAVCFGSRVASPPIDSAPQFIPTAVAAKHLGISPTAVPQGISSASFEDASELGVPKAAGPPAEALPMGFTLRDKDLATRFGWRYLREASAEQVRATMDSIIHADNKLVTGTILRRLFSPTQGVNEFASPVFGLWNGSDGLTPPPHLGKTYDDDHSHYVVTQADQIDSGDLEAGFRLVTEHGYGTRESGGQLLILAGPDESELIQGFRAGEASRPSGPEARYTFIPSKAAPPWITPDGELVGELPPATFANLPVVGQYGPAFLIESAFIPSDYVAIVATNGPGSQSNCIGVREHQIESYRGLRQIPGNGPYPIVESFSQRSFGTGVRHRGAAVILQVKSSGSYTAPTATAIPV